MVGSIFSPEVLIILIVVIGLLLGAKRIPQMARSLGSAKSEFEKGLKEGEQGANDTSSQASTEPKQD